MKLKYPKLIHLLLLTTAIFFSNLALSITEISENSNHKVLGLEKIDRIVNQYYVVLKDKDQSSEYRQAIAADFASQHKGKVIRSLKRLPIVLMEMSEKAAIALSRNPEVAFIEARSKQLFGTTQTVPSSSSGSLTMSQWGMDRIDQVNLPLDGTYTYNNDGSGANLYVVDSGIQTNTGEFSGRFRIGAVIDNGLVNGQPCNIHGTHTANLAASTTFGIAKGTTVIDVNVFNCTNGNIDAVSGLDWVVNDAIHNNHFPAVVNMSIWADGESPTMELAVQGVLNAGITFAGIAGNEGKNDCSSSSPAGVSGAIITGSSTQIDSKAAHSNFGSCLDIFAPGESIMVAYNWAQNGTSLAAPQVAGVAARYLQNNQNANPSTVKNAILNNAITGKLTGIGSGSPNKLLYSGFLDTFSQLSVTLTGDDAGLCIHNQETFVLSATASGSTPPYTFTWVGANQASSPTENPNIASVSTSGSATVQVQVIGNDGKTMNRSTTVNASCGGGGF